MEGEIEKTDYEIFHLLEKEFERQANAVNLIASENIASKAVREAMATVLTNKYAEGYPNQRYYGGCEIIDEIEKIAIERARQLFGAEHANVQPHSGTQANMAAILAYLKPGEKILSLSLTGGGHLSHGMPLSFTGKVFNVVHYNVDRETEMFDYTAIQKLAEQEQPQLIIAGASSYPREIDFEEFGKIRDSLSTRCYFLADIAHIAGLVVAGIHKSPVPYADFVTTSTHKTLRGPRGGLILCKKKHSKAIDKSVFPGVQGGPLEHIIAAKAIAFKEAQTENFKKYQQQVVKNARVLANALKESGFRIVTGGTDNHIILVDLTNKNITGAQAQKVLGEVNIIVNKNTIPYDPKPPNIASGIRLGTPYLTTRGFKENDFIEVAKIIEAVLNSTGKPDESAIKNEMRLKVKNLLAQLPFTA
ncbi:MAG: serine hydroxymethyltransferase [Planctomycetota bacterium]